MKGVILNSMVPLVRFRAIDGRAMRVHPSWLVVVALLSWSLATPRRV